MIPVATPTAMAAFDHEHRDRLDALIAAAGWQVARHCIEMLGGTYGRRVVVVAGPGNNGADGRVAAQVLAGRGVRVEIVSPAMTSRIDQPDLVIDAAYGMGLSRPYAPTPIDPSIPVLAVDVPSGLDGLTGQPRGAPLTATRTVTFVATKPGLFLGAGPSLCGDVILADLGETGFLPGRGLAHGDTDMGLVTGADAARLWPHRATNAHKWNHAVWVIGGSSTMPGAPYLAALGAQRAGAGYVRVSVPGSEHPEIPRECVHWPVGYAQWGSTIAAVSDRIGAVVVGPGLSRTDAAMSQTRDAVMALVKRGMPTVIDADALHAVVDATLEPSCVLTPHEGEFQTLTGAPVPTDRLAAVRALAASMNATILLKGPTTVIASPSGAVRFVTSGDARLATAGSGDVLSGMIGALLSYGLDPISAASVAAWVHGRAGQHGPVVGMTASDIAAAIPTVVGELVDDDHHGPGGLGRARG